MADGLLMFTDVALPVCKMQHNIKKFLAFIMSPRKKIHICPVTKFVPFKYCHYFEFMNSMKAVTESQERIFYLDIVNLFHYHTAHFSFLLPFWNATYTYKITLWVLNISMKKQRNHIKGWLLRSREKQRFTWDEQNLTYFKNNPRQGIQWEENVYIYITYRNIMNMLSNAKLKWNFN